MKTVLAFGTFDILHPGHLSYLTQAKSLGDKLVVIVATDNNVKKIKGELPLNNQAQRRELVAALDIVDGAIIGFEDDMIKSVEKVRPQIIAMGYDQKPSDEELEKKFAERGIKVEMRRMKPFMESVYKSSKIKEKARKA
ncbi:MAG: adenylyltransferase/cytidyltransferase family protein [archaeon]